MARRFHDRQIDRRQASLEAGDTLAVLRPFGVAWFVDDAAVWLVGPSGALKAPPVDLGIPRRLPQVSEDGWSVEINLNGPIATIATVVTNMRRAA